MASVRDIFVRLGVRTDPKGFKRAEQGISKLKGSAVTLGRILVTGAVALGFKKMVQLASDMEESANKFGAVFGEAGAGVQKRLEELSKSTGATNTKLTEMAANIGAIIKPALGSAEAAGKMAAGVTEMALDIASFNNVSADDALNAIRSGLIGSAEPLQRFGVDVRQSAIELEAMRQGIGGSVKEMTRAQVTTLRYAAIQRQLGQQGATGDATKTAKDFANASRNLGEALKETAAILGTFFLKSSGESVNNMREMVDTFQKWLAVNRKVIQQRIDKFLDRVSRITSAVTQFVKRVVGAMIDWARALDGVSAVMIKIAIAAGALALILLSPAASLLLLLVLVGLLIEDFEVWRKGGDSVIGDLIGGLDEMAKRFPRVSAGLGALGSVFVSLVKGWVKLLMSWAALWIQVFTVGPLEALKQFKQNVAQIFRDIFGEDSIAAAMLKFISGRVVDSFTAPIRAVIALFNGFKTFWEDLFKVGLRDAVVNFVFFFKDQFVGIVDSFKKDIKDLTNIGGKIRNLFGGDDEQVSGPGANAISGSVGAGLGALLPGGGSKTQNNNFSMVINASPNMDLEALADKVVEKTQDVMLRQTGNELQVAVP